MMFQVQTDLIEGPGELTETMIGPLRLLQLLLEVAGGLISSRLGSAVSQVTRSYAPRRMRYLPLCTNVPSTSILVSNRCFH